MDVQKAMTDSRRAIPSVDSLLGSEAFEEVVSRFHRARVVAATRAEVDEVRGGLTSEDVDPHIADPERYARAVVSRLERGDVPSLRSVINATGVVLHTNLGRAPLADAAADAMARAARGYSNLEYDVATGVRGSRYDHCVELLRELTGAEDAVVVNNNAAALVLALNTTARGGGVAVSRGELVEIGGGFRIPEILERSGASLVEVGSTNRTRASDYEEAMARGDVAAILKVHRSNFRITGFTEEASLAELSEIAGAHEVPLLHDLGSGLFVDAQTLGLPGEPLASDSLREGADLVAVSGDKLLGGPQAGIILGSRGLVAALRKNPLCRALRVDKVTLAGLEATLRLYRDPEEAIHAVPTLRMLATSAEESASRAGALATRLREVGVSCEVVETEGAVGGGTYPGVTLAGSALSLEGADGAEELATALRGGTPPVISRIVEGRVIVDLRTVLPTEEAELLSVIRGAVEADG